MRIQNNFIYSRTMLTSHQNSIAQQNNQSSDDQPVKIQKAPLLSNVPIYFGGRPEKIQDLVQATGFARKYGVKTGLPENEAKLRNLLDGKSNIGKKGKPGKKWSNNEIYNKAVQLKTDAEEARAALEAKAAEAALMAKKIKKAK